MLNIEKFKTLLAGKIDSYDRWKEICREAGMSDPEYSLNDYLAIANWPFAMHYAGTEHIGGYRAVPANQRWWMWREAARTYWLHAPATDVLTSVVSSFRLQAYYPHISKDDPNLVAYTPSMEDGMRDKQVRLSFGKFVRKMVLLATDDHIQKLEASHRSELDPSFDVARTAEEIQHVYRNMAGDSACMRYDSSEWHLPPTLHPSHAYAYAGLGIAHHKSGDTIVSRALIYDNPDDPQDKRYVRVYGDHALRRKLERAGYRMESLRGAKLKAIELWKVNKRWVENQYLIPYLDGPGGNQEDQSGCYVYRLEGEDCLRVIDKAQATRLNNMGYHAPRVKGTGAVHEVGTIPLDKLSFTSQKSGKTFNVLETNSVLVYDPETREITTCAEVEMSNRRDYGEVFNYVSNTRVPVLVPSQAMRDPKHAFVDHWHYGGYVLATDHNRTTCGLVKLDPEHYGADNWQHPSKGLVAGEGGFFWKQEDVTLLFTEDGSELWLTPAKLEALREAAPKDYVQVAPNGKQRAVSHVRNPRMVKTLGNRRCIKDWHNIMECYDGSWDYAQNIEWKSMFGTELPFSNKGKAFDLDTVRLTEELVSKYLMASLIHSARGSARRSNTERRTAISNYTRQRLMSGVDGHFYFRRGEMIFRGNIYGDVCTMDAVRQAVEMIGTMELPALADMLDEDIAKRAKTWAHHAALMLKIHDAACAEWADPAPAADPLDDQLVSTANTIAAVRVTA